MSIVVIKIGGELLQDNSVVAIAQEIGVLRRDGALPLVVHGGGPQISQWCSRLNIRTHMHMGIRVTSAEEMPIVEAALGGVNTKMVRLFNSAGVPAVGLSMSDASMSTAAPLVINGRATATAQRVTQCTPKYITQVLPHYVPIICPTTADAQGRGLNLNADVAAIELAISLGAGRLFFLSSVGAVLTKQSVRIPHLTARSAARLIKDGTITNGMKVKIENALQARRRGVTNVYIGTCSPTSTIAHIIDGRAGTILQ